MLDAQVRRGLRQPTRDPEERTRTCDGRKEQTTLCQKTLSLEGHAAAGASWRLTAQVHRGLASSAAGGNMWKYMPATIGMKTMVL